MNRTGHDVTVGIDPGKSGAMAIISGDTVNTFIFDDKSIACTIADELKGLDFVMVYLEKVHSFPGQGVASSFTFGKAFGEVVGCLDALCIPYNFVSPQKWQKTIDDIPKKKDGPAAHKRALKMAAQRRFPQSKPTLKTADALLIAAWGVKDRYSLFEPKPKNAPRKKQIKSPPVIDSF